MTKGQPLLEDQDLELEDIELRPGKTATDDVQQDGQLAVACLNEGQGVNYEGISTAEAERRQKRDGFNELAEETVNPCLKFLSYFWGPMPIMIWIAIFIEILTTIYENSQHIFDVAVLVLLQFVNGMVGWYEERNAGNAIAALKKQLSLNSNVKRDGQWVTIPARELVEGDVTHLKLGDIIPADCMLLNNVNGNAPPIQVDQSSLNGESLPKTM